MKKRIIAMLLAAAMCTELLAGCGTAIITDTGMETVADSKICPGTIPAAQEQREKSVPLEAEAVQLEAVELSDDMDLNEILSAVVDKKKTEQAELDHLYCVSWDGTDYIYGYIYDTLTKKPVEGVQVTLVDVNGKTVTDENGNPCTTRTWSAKQTWMTGGSSLSLDPGSFQLQIEGGDDYKRNYSVKLERAGYAPQSYPVTYIDLMEYQKYFEKLFGKYLTGANGILANTELIKTVLAELNVSELLEMGRNSSDYAEGFVREFILKEDELKNKKTEFLSNAKEIEKLEQDHYNEAFWNPFWKEVRGNVNRSWSEWFSGLWELLPERLQAQILLGLAYGYTS